MADWVAVSQLLLKSHEFVPELTVKTVESAAHWVMMEKPEEVNGLMREWLDARKGKEGGIDLNGEGLQRRTIVYQGEESGKGDTVRTDTLGIAGE